MGKKMMHIGLEPGAVGRYVFLPGSPERTEKIAAYFDDPKEIAYNREFRTFVGELDGVKVAVTSTGIGVRSNCGRRAVSVRSRHHDSCRNLRIHIEKSFVGRCRNPKRRGENGGCKHSLSSDRISGCSGFSGSQGGTAGSAEAGASVQYRSYHYQSIVLHPDCTGDQAGWTRADLPVGGL